MDGEGMAVFAILSAERVANSSTFLEPGRAISPDSGRSAGASFLRTRAVMESRIINERAFRFSCRIVKLCERLHSQGFAGRKIADQLFDSGTSIGANTSESQGGQTKPDFVAKLAIARKESWETIYWLQLAVATNVATKEEVAWELDEAQQLKAMITAAVKTGQSSNWRGAS